MFQLSILGNFEVVEVTAFESGSFVGQLHGTAYLVLLVKDLRWNGSDNTGSLFTNTRLSSTECDCL